MKTVPTFSVYNEGSQRSRATVNIGEK